MTDELKAALLKFFEAYLKANFPWESCSSHEWEAAELIVKIIKESEENE